jgi:hypothetical protein
MIEVPKFEDDPHLMSAKEALELGQTMLKAAFTPPYGNTPVGGYLLKEAFRLGKMSLELGSTDSTEI